MKLARYGAPVEWHQDWAFYPHTNDDLAEVGIMIDDMTVDNGLMLIIPGSQKGPIYDHHANGFFCGAINPLTSGCDFSKAVPIGGPAGSLTIHHARLVHGSERNLSSRDRRFMLFQFRTADSWPLAWAQPDGAIDINDFDKMIVAGVGTLAPRYLCSRADPLAPSAKARLNL